MAPIETSTRWTERQLLLAFYLYCQLPFGKLHSRNAEVIKMAALIGRTPSALAMKLVNFASLDSAIKNSGRKGLGNASKADREIWDKFNNNWESLANECEKLLSQTNASFTDQPEDEVAIRNYSANTREVVVAARIGQSFFRKAVLASYQQTCCMSGVAIPQLLIASHIIPWAEAKEHRLNPSNGLCLSAIHDRAYDQGFLTVKPDFTVAVSRDIQIGSGDVPQINLLRQLDGRQIILPEKFQPNKEFLLWHNQHIFRR